MKNKGRKVQDQIKKLQTSIAKFGDYDGSKKAKLSKLQGKF